MFLEPPQEHSRPSPALLGNVVPPQHVSIPNIPEQPSGNQVTTQMNDLKGDNVTFTKNRFMYSKYRTNS